MAYVAKKLRAMGLHFSVKRQLDRAGKVFRAWDREAKLDLCVRILPWSQDAERQLQVMRRVDALREIVPNLVLVRRSGSTLVLVSRWIKGRSLRSYLRARTRNPDWGIGIHQSLTMFRRFANGLSNLHRQGFVVHGDIKPENIIIEEGGVYRMILVDLGSCWLQSEARRRSMGDGITPVYAAPECQDEDWLAANYLSDQFSASVVLYEMLSGEIPYDRFGGSVGDRSIELVKPSDLLRGSGYPARVLRATDELVCRGLQLDPEDRFPKRREWQHAAHRAVEALEPKHSRLPFWLRFWRQ